MYGGGNMICRYERTIFRSDNGFCIYVYSTADPSVPEAACKRKDSGGKRAHFTAVGHFLPETDLVDVDIQGQWKQSNYGLQFEVEHFQQRVPTSRDGIIAYLTSGFVKGIGKEMAKAIVARFGTRTIEIMEKEPEQLLTIKGIKEARLKKIIESFQASRQLEAPLC